MKINCSYSKIQDVHKLIENPKNNNKHPGKQIELLAKIIDYQGQRSPIVVSNRSGFITKGHGRLMAIKKLGWDKCAVDYQDYENEAMEYADLIADNKIAELAEFDEVLMIEELKNLDITDFDLLGIPDFSLPEADIIPMADEDSIPEHVEPKTKLGDLYKLGEHRLLCGDSTSIDAVDRLMGGAKADMVFTDPPYGVNYTGGHNEKQRDGIANDTLSGEDLSNLFADSLSVAEAITEDHAAFYIWYASGKSIETYAKFERLTLKVRAVICWYKIKSGLGAFMSQYIPNYEPCIYAFKDGNVPQWFGPTDEKTVWELPRDKENKLHPTQKPIALPERAINNSSKIGQIIYDAFGGSGSTLIACEKTNRKCFMMELDPHYCDVIVARWEKYTGKTAELLNQNDVVV